MGRRTVTQYANQLKRVLSPTVVTTSDAKWISASESV